MVATRKQTEIQSAAIAHCVEKSTGREFYAVKSDSSSEWYRLTWNDAASGWDCTCPSHKPCKHIRAVCEVIRARKEAAQQAQTVIEQAVDVVAEDAHEWHDCELCGRLTRSKDGVCVTCYGPYADEDEPTPSVVTSEVTTDGHVTEHGTTIPSGTTVYRVDGELLFWDDLMQDWFCTCQETVAGVSYGCEHGAHLRTLLNFIAQEREAA